MNSFNSVARALRFGMIFLAILLTACGGGGSGGGGTVTAPAAPVGVNAVAASAQNTITWNAVTGATSYNIYWRTTTAGVTKINGTKITGASSSYVHSSLTNGTAYYYVVTAVNAGGESVDSAEVTATPQVTAPNAPTVVVATSGNTQATISWGAVTGATSYNIYWRTTTGVTKINGTKITGASSPYVHTSLSNGTPYYYVVTAVNAGGESVDSTEVTVTPNVPPAVVISNLRDKGVVHSGFIIGTAAFAGLTAVNVSLDNGATWTNATGTTTWKFMLPSGANTWKEGSQHTIQVRATDSTNFSTPVTITVRKGVNKDVNGDGYADLAVGANAATVSGVYNSGAVYVFHGSATGVASTTAASANATVTGSVTIPSQFGNTVALGDLNGDGYADLIVGAPFAETDISGTIYTGAVYVFNGSSSGISSGAYSTSSAALLGQPSTTGGSFFGISAVVGDVNGDGYGDLAVGKTDVVYVFHGSSAGVASGVVTANAAVETIILGSSNTYFGNSLAMGDANGDGYADMAVGLSHPYGGAYVFHGSASGITATADTAANTTLTGTGSSYFGISVAMGDANGDGYADVAVGADTANSNYGAAYVFNGSASGVASASTTNASSTLSGLGRNFGRSVDLGDVNGDGYADLAVGAYAPSSGLDGETYIFNGTASGVVNASVTNAATTLAGPLNGYFGLDIALSDLNGDGYADLAIGAMQVSSSGAIYAYHGSSTGISATSYTGAVTTLTGINTASQFGSALGR